MLSGEGIQRRRTVKNDNRSSQKKSNFARAAHFFVHFFTDVLHDYNVKLPETSQLHVLWRKCCTRSCSLFSTVAHFHLALMVAASIPHFFTAATKFFFQISVALFLVELRWPAAHFLFFSLEQNLEHFLRYLYLGLPLTHCYFAARW